MTRVDFVIGVDEATGTVGLLHAGGMPDVVDGESTAAYIGGLVAHDIVEHCNGVENIGSVEDEVLALGAVWFTRVDTGHYHGYQSPKKWLSYDCGRMLELSWFGDDVLYIGPNVSTGCDSTDSELLRVAVEGARSWLGELEHHDGDGPTWVDVLWHTRKLYRGLKAGYKAASERWGDCYKALAMWQAVEAAADPVLKQYADDAYVGLPVTLEYSTENGTANMYANEEAYYEYE